MYFKQFYLGCLAHASYLIGSGGEAAVIDPQRDVDQYIDDAAANGLAIRHVIETHLHADFVSGHCELARRTGARVYVGRAARASYTHVAVADGDEIALGDIRLRFLETPGHTLESISVLVIDPTLSPEPQMILTGDTLFIGDVGRPDLAGAKGITPQQMAGTLYDTLRTKILPLPDSVLVYPAHGAGSACGKNISKDTFSTLGEQRQSNYALREMPREEFIRLVTTDLVPAPDYFSYDAEINRRGAAALEDLPEPPALPPKAVRERIDGGAVALDVRENTRFGAAHVPGSVNIGLRGQFAPWVGTLLEPSRGIVVIADSIDDVRETVTRLARVGYERVEGYLDGGAAAWERAGLPLDSVEQIGVGGLAALIESTVNLQVVDVRRMGEYGGGHVPHAVNAPLDRLRDRANDLDPARPTAVICAGGYRSSAATSILQAMGFERLYNVLGGTAAWVNAGYETSTEC